jgi:hypothetical protein
MLIDEPQSCPCGYYSIRDLFIIGDKFTGREIDAGNHCVKLLLGLPLTATFPAIQVGPQGHRELVAGWGGRFLHDRGIPLHLGKRGSPQATCRGFQPSGLTFPTKSPVFVGQSP